MAAASEGLADGDVYAAALLRESHVDAGVDVLVGEQEERAGRPRRSGRRRLQVKGHASSPEDLAGAARNALAPKRLEKENGRMRYSTCPAKQVFRSR